MGLEFTQKQWPTLEQELIAAAGELGFVDLENFAEWLLSTSLSPEHTSVLASYLAVGKSSFFRGPNAFDILKRSILPKLIRQRNQTGHRRLKLWSAGCSTGEEAYSLAITLYESLPNIAEWDISILGTDFNMRALEHARRGRYSLQAFPAPPSTTVLRHFTLQGTQFELAPHIKEMVHFSCLNLLDECYPSVTNGTYDIDIALCRNVLIYLSRQARNRVFTQLSHSMKEGGWLLVGPSEAAYVPETHFRPVAFPQAFFFCKHHEGKTAWDTARKGLETAALDRSAELQWADFAKSHRRFVRERHLESSDSEQDRTSEQQQLTILDEELFSKKECDLLARVCLKEKRLEEALVWNEKTLSADNFNAGFHYVRAQILQQQQNFHEARIALRRSLYLDPQCVLANFDMGRLARQRGRLKESLKYFKNVLSLLQHYEPHEILPESDALQAQTLQNAVNAIMREKVS